MLQRLLVLLFEKSVHKANIAIMGVFATVGRSASHESNSIIAPHVINEINGHVRSERWSGYIEGGQDWSSGG